MQTTVQNKYKDKSFDESLLESNLSQLDLYNRILDISPIIHGRNMEDKKAFESRNGHRIRYWDIEVSINGKIYFVEYKEWSRMIYYEATGVPCSYAKKLFNAVGDTSRLIFIFKDSENLLNERFKLKADKFKSMQGLIDKTQFVSGTEAKPEFHYYGHKANFLMEHCRKKHIEDIAKSSLTAYKGEQQYIWNTNFMMPLEQLFIKIIGETHA